MMKCIVVDDDPVQREAIKSCIAKVKDLDLVGVYPNAIEARIALQKREVDLIFLDVEMPEMSGIEFLASFKEVPQVIMVTAKKHYAFEAFEYDVTDYISKPIDIFCLSICQIFKSLSSCFCFSWGYHLSCFNLSN